MDYYAPDRPSRFNTYPSPFYWEGSPLDMRRRGFPTPLPHPEPDRARHGFRSGFPAPFPHTEPERARRQFPVWNEDYYDEGWDGGWGYPFMGPTPIRFSTPEDEYGYYRPLPYPHPGPYVPIGFPLIVFEGASDYLRYAERYHDHLFYSRLEWPLAYDGLFHPHPERTLQELQRLMERWRGEAGRGGGRMETVIDVEEMEDSDEETGRGAGHIDVESMSVVEEDTGTIVDMQEEPRMQTPEPVGVELEELDDEWEELEDMEDLELDRGGDPGTAEVAHGHNNEGDGEGHENSGSSTPPQSPYASSNAFTPSPRSSTLDSPVDSSPQSHSDRNPQQPFRFRAQGEMGRISRRAAREAGGYVLDERDLARPESIGLETPTQTQTTFSVEESLPTHSRHVRANVFMDVGEEQFRYTPRMPTGLTSIRCNFPAHYGQHHREPPEIREAHVAEDVRGGNHYTRPGTMFGPLNPEVEPLRYPHPDDALPSIMSQTRRASLRLGHGSTFFPTGPAGVSIRGPLAGSRDY